MAASTSSDVHAAPAQHAEPDRAPNASIVSPVSTVGLLGLLPGKHAGGVNLRDVGALYPSLLPGRLYRSSQVLNPAELAGIGVRSVLDLRQKAAECGRHEERFIDKVQGAVRRSAASIASAPAALIPEPLMPENLRRHPIVCVPCSDASRACYGTECKVYHDRAVSWTIFYAMPRYVKVRTLRAVLSCGDAAAVMAPAVADARHYGYLKLYQTLLDSAKAEMAKGLRVLSHASNLPVIVHCIHGKDRTGVFVMLVLLLCGVPREVVVEEYLLSHALLRDAKAAGELALPAHLTRDEVIAAEREVITGTIEYLQENYGSAERYARAAGLTPEEVAHVRCCLLAEPGEDDLAATAGASSARRLSLDPRNLARLLRPSALLATFGRRGSSATAGGGGAASGETRSTDGGGAASAGGTPSASGGQPAVDQPAVDQRQQQQHDTELEQWVVARSKKQLAGAAGAGA